MTILNRTFPRFAAESTASELKEQTQHVLQRIEDSKIDAFSWIQHKPPALQGESIADTLVQLPLAGLPVAIKEVIDVAGAPIGYGCDAFAGRTAITSADIVMQLEALGAQVVGITRSTEMAIAKETTTRNPWSLNHSPGGSSSGSAAAVGAGLVPFALGTQTIGSVIRPAAYCGVIGFKPSIGIGSIAGVLPLSQTLDHVGYFADSLQRMTDTVSILFPDLPSAPGKSPRLIFIEPWFERHELEPFFIQRDFLKTACDQLGIDWTEQSLAQDVTSREAGLVKTILYYEMFATWGDKLLSHPDTSDELKSLLQFGGSIEAEEYKDALRLRLDMIEQVERNLAEGDIIVFPSVLGQPPELGQGTGSRDPQRLWTLLGLPTLNLPIGWDESFPFNLQLIGRRGADRHLLEAGRVVSRLIEQVVPQRGTG